MRRLNPPGPEGSNGKRMYAAPRYSWRGLFYTIMKFNLKLIVKAASITFVLLFLCSCTLKKQDLQNNTVSNTVPDFTPEEKERLFIEIIISEMNIVEQVAQMFILSAETEWGRCFTDSSDELKFFINENKAGGYVLFSNNITTLDGTKSLTDGIMAYSKIPPFIAIDEEGGVVSRLFSARLTELGELSIIGSDSMPDVYNDGRNIGRALVSIGVNLNFAPVADVLTIPDNIIISGRSYGSDPYHVSEMVSYFLSGLRSQGVMSSPKHFPGHGNTTSDSHYGIAVIESDAEHLANIEYKPFIRAINEKCEFVMVGHIAAPNVDPSGLPATVSSFFVSDTLRHAMGFDGVIITDAMNMGAIVDNYSTCEAAVMAILAGVDMILMPKNYGEALDGVLRAINSGVISHDRIHESLERILRTKIKAGMITY